MPDPQIEEPTDAIIEVTSTNICGSDLHLYEVLGAFMNRGAILGHEPMGIVREVERDVGTLCGRRRRGHSLLDVLRQLLYVRPDAIHPVRTQVRDQGMGATLFGYSELHGAVPGGQAELLRVPQAQFTHIKVSAGPPDSRFVSLSDVLPTAWQAVDYAEIPDEGSVTVLGLGPIGDMAARIADHLGYRVIAVDRVPERLARASARGIETVDLREHGDDLADVVRDMTRGRGTDASGRCGGNGSTRFATSQDRAPGNQPVSRRSRQTLYAERRNRPPRGALQRHRHRPARRNHLI